MAFETVAFVRALHVIFAALWVGGGFFASFILGPNLRAAGPAAGPFMATVVRRGGFSWFFALTGLVTIATGGFLYGELGYAAAPFGDGARASVTVGAILAVLALVEGAAVLGPNERRMKKLVQSMPAQGPPSAEQAAEMQRLGMKQGKASARSTVLITLALLAMTLRVLF
jgi:uncharacterized membrane protein